MLYKFIYHAKNKKQKQIGCSPLHNSFENKLIQFHTALYKFHNHWFVNCVKFDQKLHFLSLIKAKNIWAQTNLIHILCTDAKQLLLYVVMLVENCQNNFQLRKQRN